MENCSIFILFLLQFLMQEQQILVYAKIAAVLITFLYVICFQFLWL